MNNKFTAAEHVLDSSTMCSGQLSLLPSAGRQISSSLLADWGGGMSASCTTGPTVCWRREWMAAAVSLVHANQLPLPRL